MGRLRADQDMSKEIIDFRQELERHQEFLGREDMIAELRREGIEAWLTS